MGNGNEGIFKCELDNVVEECVETKVSEEERGNRVEVFTDEVKRVIRKNQRITRVEQGGKRSELFGGKTYGHTRTYCKRI